MWRGEPADDEGDGPSRLTTLEVLTAIRDGSGKLFEGCPLKDARSGTEPNFVDKGEIKYFDSRHVDIKEVYTALHLYARNKRMSGRPFKLKTIVLSGELGGRGISYKPRELKGDDGTLEGVDIIEAHQGYLTDEFYMLDAVKNRQTQHGEQSLQNIGRLCTLTDAGEHRKMKITPPRLWTSHSCYNVIEIFGLCVDQWVTVMREKEADEAMKDAVVRCIKNDPERFAVLYMVYALPTTDRRWAKKDRGCASRG